MGSWSFFMYTLSIVCGCVINKEYTEIKVLFHSSKDKD